MIGFIQQAVDAHDSYQIELKLDYELSAGNRTEYRVETYFFVPRALSIHKESYSKSEFYGDVNSYIRLKTPMLILRDFAESAASPLYHIRKIIDEPGWVTDSNRTGPLIEQFKLLASMIKSSIREHTDHLDHQLHSTHSSDARQILVESLTAEFLQATQRISTIFRSFFVTFRLPKVNANIVAAYTFTDESISILIEEGLIELWQLLESHSQLADKPHLRRQLKERIKAETCYRKTRTYPSILSQSSDNEAYQYRASVLKKFASSVLYLSTELRREGTRLEHIVMALAAGVSMLFATATAFYFQYHYGNFTMPFFAALVVGYMFKDRIKEIGRSLFLQQLHERLYDRRIGIYTQDRKHHLGVLREKVTFLSDANLPRRIREARNSDQLSQIENEGLGETVICYTKQIVLYSDTIRQIFGSTFHITGINDIIRFDTRRLLTKMDDPVQRRFVLVDGKLQAVPVHKVYHVNLISKYATRNPQKDKIYKRHRLVLNRSGIKRIEPVPL